jgi:hypothetical protein
VLKSRRAAYRLGSRSPGFSRFKGREELRGGDERWHYMRVVTGFRCRDGVYIITMGLVQFSGGFFRDAEIQSYLKN